MGSSRTVGQGRPVGSSWAVGQGVLQIKWKMLLILTFQNVPVTTKNRPIVSVIVINDAHNIRTSSTA